MPRRRFSASAVGDLESVWRTWHPRSRPEALTPDTSLEWTALEVLDVVAGGTGDENGEVEFRAHYLQDRRSGALHERSRFVVRARRWFYVDGTLFE
jgi:SEC-C motif-containing protein